MFTNFLKQIRRELKYKTHIHTYMKTLCYKRQVAFASNSIQISKMSLYTSPLQDDGKQTHTFILFKSKTPTFIEFYIFRKREEEGKCSTKK